ncbi:hypothetical protein BDV18DRAFT_2790 [Aspergillus unguis]
MPITDPIFSCLIHLQLFMLTWLRLRLCCHQAVSLLRLKVMRVASPHFPSKLGIGAVELSPLEHQPRKYTCSRQLSDNNDGSITELSLGQHLGIGISSVYRAAQLVQRQAPSSRINATSIHHSRFETKTHL